MSLLVLPKKPTPGAARALLFREGQKAGRGTPAPCAISWPPPPPQKRAAPRQSGARPHTPSKYRTETKEKLAHRTGKRGDESEGVCGGSPMGGVIWVGAGRPKQLLVFSTPPWRHCHGDPKTSPGTSAHTQLISEHEAQVRLNPRYRQGRQGASSDVENSSSWATQVLLGGWPSDTEPRRPAAWASQPSAKLHLTGSGQEGTAGGGGGTRPGQPSWRPQGLKHGPVLAKGSNACTLQLNSWTHEHNLQPHKHLSCSRLEPRGRGIESTLRSSL